MPSLIGNTVAANYLKTKPTTQFGTRQLSVLNIAIDGVFVDHALADSLFSKAVRAVQQTAEVWAVFTPIDAGTDSFNVIIATDTQYVGDSETSRTAIPSGGLQPAAGYGIFETAIQAGCGVAATVTAPAGFVAPFSG